MLLSRVLKNQQSPIFRDYIVFFLYPLLVQKRILFLCFKLKQKKMMSVHAHHKTTLGDYHEK